jgi:hypothetical protein
MHSRTALRVGKRRPASLTETNCWRGGQNLMQTITFKPWPTQKNVRRKPNRTNGPARVTPKLNLTATGRQQGPKRSVESKASAGALLPRSWSTATIPTISPPPGTNRFRARPFTPPTRDRSLVTSVAISKLYSSCGTLSSQNADNSPSPQLQADTPGRQRRYGTKYVSTVQECNRDCLQGHQQGESAPILHCFLVCIVVTTQQGPTNAHGPCAALQGHRELVQGRGLVYEFGRHPLQHRD